MSIAKNTSAAVFEPRLTIIGRKTLQRRGSILAGPDLGAPRRNTSGTDMDDLQYYAWLVVVALLLWPVCRLVYLWLAKHQDKKRKMADFHVHRRHKARLK